MAAVEDAAEVGVDDLVPLLDGHVGDVGERADAGVVDQDVEAAERAHGLVDRARRVVGIADVGADLAHVRAVGAPPDRLVETTDAPASGERPRRSRRRCPSIRR